METSFLPLHDTRAPIASFHWVNILQLFAIDPKNERQLARELLALMGGCVFFVFTIAA